MTYKDFINKFIEYTINLKRGDSIAEEQFKEKYKQVNLVYSKRFVVEKNPNKVMALDIRDFLRPSKTLLIPKGRISFKEIMEENLNYVSDNWAVKGLLDFWQYPEETDILRGGDCEDLSFYRIVKTISNNPETKGYLFCALGFVKINNKWIGHAYPILWQNQELKIYEATINSSKEMNNSEYNTYYIFNDKYCFELKKGSFGAKSSLLKEFGCNKI